MAVRKTGWSLVALVLGGPWALPALAQDEPPPPPPPGPRSEGGRAKLLDPADPNFHGAALGDLSEKAVVGDELVFRAVGGVSQPVWLRFEGLELRCDSAVIWGDRERLDKALSQRSSVDAKDPDDLLGNVFHAIYAEGKVFVRRDGYSFHADRVLLDFRSHHAYMVNVLMQGSGKVRGENEIPIGLRAAVVRGVARDKYRAEDATLTSCTYEHPHLGFSTSWVTVDYSKEEPRFETGWWPTLRADTPFGKDLPIIPLPKLGGTLGTQPVQNLEYSRSSRFGTTLGLGFGGKLERDDGTTWGTWQLTPRWRSSRGAGIGLEVDHSGAPVRPGGPKERLEFTGAWQRDRQSEDSFSDRPFDGLRGGDSSPDRGRAQIRYTAPLGDDAGRDFPSQGWRLDTAASWYSDRGYIPEYDQDLALREPQQETFAEVSRTWATQSVSLLGSRRLVDETYALTRAGTDPFRTDYATSTDYLPAATWHLVNHPVVPWEATRLAPLNLSMEASVANVERRYDDAFADDLRRTSGWTSRRILREDVEARATVPFELGPVQVTPAFGGSVYHVSEANGFANAGTSDARDPEGRHALFGGLRVGTEAHRDWDVRNDALDLDGLRHVASLDAQWFDRFDVSDVAAHEFQQNDLHDRLTEENILSLRLRNRLQTKREDEVVDWIDYEARFLYYLDESRRVPPTGLGLREEFPTPLERTDFPAEDKYLARTRDGSAFLQHRARIEALPQVWLVGEADYDMTASWLESSAAGVRWFPDKRFSVYVGRRAIRRDSAIWTLRADYRLSEKWAFSGEFQQDTMANRGLRTRFGLYRRSHDFTIALEFQSERLLKETGVAFMIYPHDWLARKGDPFSQRRPLDFDALRWYR